MHSIEELRTLFIAYLEKESFTKEPSTLYEPNNYFLKIGGKRLRPTLLLLATEIFEGKLSDALPAALAMEYFHNFTLIHDDVMDDAPLRRNVKTVHEKYNLNTAILSGDVLLVKAYEYLGKTNQQHFKKVFDIYTKTAVEVCEGQQYDIDFETKTIVSHDEYINMIRLKTSVLLAAAMKIGAVLGNAEDSEAELLYRFAENLGIAFQIQDDILDAFGDENMVGKQPGGDIIQNKKTLLLIEALRLSKSKNDSRLEKWMVKKMFDNTEKVNTILQIFDEYAIKQYAIEKRNQYVQNANEALNKMQITAQKKEVLKSLVDYLVLREF